MRRHTFREWCLLLEAVWLLLLARLVLLIVPFGSVVAGLERTSTLRGDGATAPPQLAQRVAWAVDAASRRVPGTRNCLIRALAATGIIVSRGYRVQLLIGVARSSEGRLLAHAWVENNGTVVIGGDGLDAFTPLTAEPRPR